MNSGIVIRFYVVEDAIWKGKVMSVQVSDKLEKGNYKVVILYIYLLLFNTYVYCISSNSSVD